jgi:hypothetical protein
MIEGRSGWSRNDLLTKPERRRFEWLRPMYAIALSFASDVASRVNVRARRRGFVGVVPVKERENGRSAIQRRRTEA